MLGARPVHLAAPRKAGLGTRSGLGQLPLVPQITAVRASVGGAGRVPPPRLPPPASGPGGNDYGDGFKGRLILAAVGQLGQLGVGLGIGLGFGLGIGLGFGRIGAGIERGLTNFASGPGNRSLADGVAAGLQGMGTAKARPQR
ncbi:hypothetical protein HYH03_006494 [Edaphochlamys debaryana]|uniref:Uncharacterized protein n=1 Tax=Edaphochlamys debaryana TaxID=47281 RepID=A0A836C085_9CHLO|nr:hypothetical protein HYH03_006494 [Edaphochlamys debaryana]|eukprot:KAG2495551.1 hypothetical protein HYH03_006494 [Edaphochlamys debaryana]